MTFFTTLIASQALIFSGGSVRDLTETLSEWSNGIAVTLLDDCGPYKAFKIDARVAGDPKDVTRLAFARGNVKLNVASYGVGASRGVYGMEVRETYPSADVWLTKRGQKIEGIHDKFFENRKVNLVTGPNKGVSLRELANQSFSKPLRMHWLYERMVVAVHAKEANEKYFLRVLASAIGAKFTDKEQEYHLDFDPAAVREFAARTNEISVLDPHDSLAFVPYRKLSSQLAALAWREASLETVSRAFLKLNGGTSYKASNSSYLNSLMHQKLSYMVRLAQDPRVDQSERETLRTQLSLADLDGDPRVVLTPNLGVCVALPAKGGGTILL